MGYVINQRLIVTGDCEPIELSFVFFAILSRFCCYPVELELICSKLPSKPLSSRIQAQILGSEEAGPSPH